MRILYFWLLFLLGAEASIFDFMTIKEANRAYQEGNYTKAVDDFGKLEKRTPDLQYDLANSYYKKGDYKKARELYEAIASPKLSFEKYHNLGNTYAHLGKLDEAIKAYEKALKIKQDEQTKFNLDLVKKMKKKREEKRKEQQKNKKKNQNQKGQQGQNKKEDQKKQNKKEKGKEGQKDKKDKSNKNKEKKKNANNQSKQKQKNDAKANQKRRLENQAKQSKKADQKEASKPKAQQKAPKKELKEHLTKAQQATPVKKAPISDKEVRKYLNRLENRGINTLLVPLHTKGEKDEQLNDW